MKNLHLLIIISFLFVACGGLKDAGKVLRNEKIRTTDEFLVKKRNPLILPPNYEEVPTPGSTSIKEENDEEKIKKILKASEVEKKEPKSSSIEKSILEQIKK